MFLSGSFPHHFQPYLIISPSRPEDFARRLLSTAGNRGEHLSAQRCVLAKARRVAEELPAKRGHLQGRSAAGALRKGLEDGNKAHFIQLEPQAGLKGSGKQLLQLESGQGVLKYQLAKLSPKHANGPGVSRITDLVFNSAIFPRISRTRRKPLSGINTVTDPWSLETLWVCLLSSGVWVRLEEKGSFIFSYWRKKSPLLALKRNPSSLLTPQDVCRSDCTQQKAAVSATF